MYFISQGSVSVSTLAQTRPRILSEGEHFGEICLFVSNLKRTATVVAQTNAYVYTLAADDFNSTLRWYPSEKVEMQRVAIERMEMLLNNVRRATVRRKTRANNDKGLEIDDEIYQELEAQRNALIDVQKKTENQINLKSHL
jgi:CRP-like cAMP-binding protein